MNKWLVLGLVLIGFLIYLKNRKADPVQPTPDESKAFKPPFENIEESPVKIDPVTGEVSYETIYKPLPYEGNYFPVLEWSSNG